MCSKRRISTPILFLTNCLLITGCAGLGWHPVEINENLIELPSYKAGYYVYEFADDANIRVSDKVKPEATTIGDIDSHVSCNCSLIIDSIDEQGNIEASFGTLPKSSKEGDRRPGRTRSGNLLTQDLQYQIIDRTLPMPRVGEEISVIIHAIPRGQEIEFREQAGLKERLRQQRIRSVYSQREARRLEEERRKLEEAQAAEVERQKKIELAAALELKLENERREAEMQRVAAEARAEADRKRREEARLAQLERRKIQAEKAAEEERRRQAYLNSPEGRAETAANEARARAREQEEARLRAEARAAWPSNARGKIASDSLICKSPKSAIKSYAQRRLPVYVQPPYDCETTPRDLFFSSVRDLGYGYGLKVVNIMGVGGGWIVSGSDVEM